ncbi:cation diffusion facilitator family transporter [Rhodococcus sp. IEGM 1401]|uniref:cation diffusion facilitator family transporter n=1 Tax=unclassified Rhodococcus (in: high G+C Gram-positive bacteria) TaxID=192944 RepID=UPI0022B2E9DF|nr:MULTISPECIES: cation diffusion facilitator family transporter [unclassified Rhodococcus (in: high G+C Gram-positive bacteria)]MCZ4564187.1 cation diffusion facilitator family transporter [Rhodococcus sp. IEGM 1401]MDI9924317.1 cation diffusion facilitator family transporter [Rhodococcus sp. IEGM 1372]MDI9927906.1 cation diffusion facilitator family transporter [Rhodococcus sp. IEGM 1341]MDV8036762.1 cation diffusion facilitator family transporter [Rhodococcus sp. IEGM 1414]
MGAGHGHSHGVGGHSPAGAGPPRSRVRKMVVALVVLVVFLVVEATVALAIGSLGLLADAGHMLTDVLGMSMGLIALMLARKGSAAAARTFGWHRAEVLTAIANAVLLLGVAAFIMYEAISRIGDAPEIPGVPLILTATAGLAANIVVMLLIRGDAKDSLAVRGAYMEVLADAVGSVGVLVAGVLMVVFGWTWADIVVGVLISLWVIPRAIKLAGSALRILTQASPANVDVDALTGDLSALPGVTGVHDLHVWTLTTGMDVATVHLECEGSSSMVLDRAKSLLSGYGLDHATVQVEPAAQGRTCKEELTW